MISAGFSTLPGSVIEIQFAVLPRAATTNGGAMLANCAEATRNQLRNKTSTSTSRKAAS